VSASIDYVEVADPDRLTPYGHGQVGARALLALAARIGATRLIDNMVLGEEPPPSREQAGFSPGRSGRS
jgi:pantoate--beta-alanine ligase